MGWATAFRLAADQERFLNARRIVALLERVSAPPGCQSQLTEPAELDSAVRGWQHCESVRYSQLLREATEDAAETQMVNQALVASAPMGAVLGCWLQGMSAPGVFEDSLQLKLLALLADDVGVGCPEASRSAEFRTLLRRFDLHSWAVGPVELTFTASIPDEAFAVPALLLAMSRRSDHFGAELCGVDLTLRAAGLLPVWTPIRARHPDLIDWRRLDLAMARDPAIIADPLESSHFIAEQLCALGEPLRQRLLGGASWALEALRSWSSFVYDSTRAALDPYHGMAMLIRHRAREAAVYHSSYRLQGCPLSEHFKEAASHPQTLLQALARSPLVTPGEADRSALLGALIGPRGRMFRVFTPEEVAVIRRWIDSLPQGAAPQHREASNSQLASDGDLGVADQTGPEESVRPDGIRDAYFILQGRALPAPVRSFAIDYVRAWMRHAARSAPDTQHGLPAIWPEDGLGLWLTQQHERADHGFRESADSELPTREALTDSSLQLAPLLCIDGAWLQGFTDICLASSTIGFGLFETYWDELGNGRYELNHPRIYRDLLRQMGIELAPTGSWQFCQDARLREESFRLPVLWLCLGKLPLTFLPEILGLNLAMELSGVGGGYRSAHRFLQHHGFSTHFVDLHNTIDNVTTGHSAWAANAVDCYMRTELRRLAGTERTQQWERVRTGFAALTTSPAPANRWLAKVRAKLRADKVRRPQANPVEPVHHEWMAFNKRA